MAALRQSSLLSFFCKPKPAPAPPLADSSDSLTPESSCSLDHDSNCLPWAQLLAGSTSWTQAAAHPHEPLHRDQPICDDPAYDFPNGNVQKRKRTQTASSKNPAIDLCCSFSQQANSARSAHFEDVEDGHGFHEKITPDLCSSEAVSPSSSSAPDTIDSAKYETLVPKNHTSFSARFTIDPLKFETVMPKNQNKTTPPRASKPIELKAGRRNRKVSAPSDPVAPPVTNYELQREENIRRNHSFLEKLGISSTAATSTQRPRNDKPKSNKAVSHTPAPALPLRRSTRRCPNAAEIDLQPDADKEPMIPDCIADPVASYDDSSILKYTCGESISKGVIQAYEHSNSDEKRILGFRPLPMELQDPFLTRIYAMDAGFVANSRALLVAGGHQGQIAVFGTYVGTMDGVPSNEENPLESFAESRLPEQTGPLLSWKGSSGWISGVKLISSQCQQENAMLLLSSSNDGNVVLWDVNKQQKIQHSGARLPPLKVTEARNIHSSGIFSMHELGGQVATASKDSAIGYSKITATEIILDRSVSGHHAGAIRGVNFRDGFTLVDCGADGLICILDLRMPEPCALTIDTNDATGVNVVEWCPSQDNLLLSASKDPQLSLHDIRNPEQPLHRLSGHVDLKLQRCSQIYRPAFVAQGRAVATPGQGSKSLFLYSAETGKAISRGFLGYDASMVMWTSQGGDGGSSVLWVAAKHVSQLVPVWQNSEAFHS